MKEKAGFRAELQNIRERFGEKNLLSKKDVCDYTGSCFRTVNKRFKFTNGKITQNELARQLI